MDKQVKIVEDYISGKMSDVLKEAEENLRYISPDEWNGKHRDNDIRSQIYAIIKWFYKVNNRVPTFEEVQDEWLFSKEDNHPTPRTDTELEIAKQQYDKLIPVKAMEESVRIARYGRGPSGMTYIVFVDGKRQGVYTYGDPELEELGGADWEDKVVSMSESVSDKSNWTVTVYDGSKKVESYTSKDKTEAEVSQESKDKIKGKKSLRAVYKKSMKEQYEESQNIEEASQVEYVVPQSNLTVVGFGRDLNGNPTIQIKTPNERVRSLQIGDVFGGKTVRNEYWKTETPERTKQINKELIDYVSKFEKGVRLKIDSMAESFLSRASKYLKEDAESGEEDYESEIAAREEVQEDVPQEDDCFISDNTRGGYDVSCGGKFVGNFTEYDAAVIAIGDWMEKSKWYPAVWSVSDHGNMNLIANFQEELRAIEASRAGELAKEYEEE